MARDKGHPGEKESPSLLPSPSLLLPRDQLSVSGIGERRTSSSLTQFSIFVNWREEEEEENIDTWITKNSRIDLIERKNASNNLISSF